MRESAHQSGRWARVSVKQALLWDGIRNGRGQGAAIAVCPTGGLPCRLCALRRERTLVSTSILMGERETETEREKAPQGESVKAPRGWVWRWGGGGGMRESGVPAAVSEDGVVVGCEYNS